MTTRLGWLFVLVTACGAPAEPTGESFDPEPAGEGVAWDADHPGADPVGKADRPKTYEVPLDLPALERPEVIVSLEGLTVHLFDRSTEQSWVFPTGVGKLGSSGRSITPRGFFRTHQDPDEYWYNIPRRYVPEYFGGFPFLRLDATNSRGQHTYGLHGPISYRCTDEGCGLLEREWFLKRDYVSHGCMRMRQDDIVALFWSLRGHSSVPVAIQGAVELDAAGQPVDVDAEGLVLWREGDAIEYGDCGARPDPHDVDGRWASAKCG